LGSEQVKALRKTFMKWRPGVNFINILQAPFMRANPKSTKKDSQIVSLFALLGSERVKALRKTLMKLRKDLLDLMTDG